MHECKFTALIIWYYCEHTQFPSKVATLNWGLGNKVWVGVPKDITVYILSSVVI